MKANIKYYLIFIAIISALVPKLFVVKYEYVESFTYSILSNVGISRDYGYVLTEPFNTTGWWQNHANFISERKAPIMIYLFLSYVLGMDELKVARLPLSGFVYALFCYVIAKKLSNSVYAGLMYTLIMSYDFLTNLVYTSLSYHQLGLLLHLLFLLVLYDVFSNVHKQRRSHFLLLLLIFLTLYWTYYSFEFLTIAFVASLYLLTTFEGLRIGKTASEERITHTLKHLLLAMGIIFLGFDTIVYSIKRMGYFGLSGFIEYVLRTLRFEAHEVYNPSFSYQYLAMRSVYLQLLLIVSIVYIMLFVRSLLKREYVSPESLFFTSLFLTSIMESTIYASLGVPGSRYFIKFMPLGIIIMLMKSNPLPSAEASLSIKQRMTPRAGFAKNIVVVAMLSLILLSSFYAINYPASYGYLGGKYHFSLTSPLANWFSRHTDIPTSFVASHHTAGLMLYVLTINDKGDMVSVNQFNYDAYKFLNPNKICIHELFIKNHYEFVFLQYGFARLPFYGAYTIVLPPLGNYTEPLGHFTYFSKVYDDGNNIVFKFNIPSG